MNQGLRRSDVARRAISVAVATMALLVPAARSAAAVRVCFLFCAPSPTVPPTTVAPATVPPVPPPPPLAEADPDITVPIIGPPREAPGSEQLLGLINAERVKVGVRPLAASAAARAVALNWSKSMTVARMISHNDAYFSPANRRALGASVLGENVAMDSRVVDAHDNLMQSEHHRANIVDPRFNAVGLGIATDGSGVLFITEDFLQGSGVASPRATVASAPKAPAPPRAVASPRPAVAPRTVAVGGPASRVTTSTTSTTLAPQPPEARTAVAGRDKMATLATTPVASRPAEPRDAVGLVGAGVVTALLGTLFVRPRRRPRAPVASVDQP